MRRVILVTAVTAVATAGVALTTTPSGSAPLSPSSTVTAARPGRLPGGFKHLVVIYLENHSFDNLYGGWGSVSGQDVEGLDDADAPHTVQVAQDATTFDCLFQNDVNLASPPLPGQCTDSHQVTGASAPGFASHFPNQPFRIDDYIQPDDTTCPGTGAAQPNGWKDGTGTAGGCTRDLVHRFYQEQYQIDGGRQDRYVTGSDAAGLTMGNYDTKQLPVYRYLHREGAPHYVIADRFFQAAFGGSFLNHQWLIAARSPYDDRSVPLPTDRIRARNSALDAAGMPVGTRYPMYAGAGTNTDFEETVPCASGAAVNDYEHACGSFAVNTIQPLSPPFNPGGRTIPLIDDDAYPNIGDRLTDAGVSWGWYAGRWDQVKNGASADAPLFQYHHQPFSYFADYAPGEAGRAHLRDEKEFFTAAETGTLPAVSFVKPYALENEHPGYASESTGSDHTVELLKAVTEGPQAGNTLVVVTYDEFGGQWDHVSPPTNDAWGPGTRIPALIVARSLTRSGVDHTTYDTTSILATIEHSWGLDPLSSRDAAVNDLSNAVGVGGR